MTATSERIVLDPAEASTGRDELDITPWLRQEGIDWGEAAIEAYLSEQSRGETPVDYRIPNREIDVPLQFVGTLGGTTTTTARANIQAKLSLFQKEGGWLKRITNSGGTVYADVVSSSFIATSVSGIESAQNVEYEAQAVLTCIPDFYGDERTLTDHTELTLPDLTLTEPGIAGDYPARVRIVVDEDSGQDQRGLIWGFRNRHYSSASTARLAYEAEAGGNLDTARILALTGASGGTAVTHGTISTSWTPVWGSNLGGTTYLTHTGTYRLYGRVYSTSGTTVQTRAVWDVGDLVNPAENPATRLPGASNFYIVDYGELRLDQSPVGTHRWRGQIQAKGDVGTENFSVDRVWLVPQDEGCGVLTAPLAFDPGLVTYLARSEFNTESGAVTGDAPAAGAVWTVVTNSDTDDFTVSGGLMMRATNSATGTFTPGLLRGAGRAISIGTTSQAATAVQVDVKVSAEDSQSSTYSGVFARSDGANNGLYAFFQTTFASGFAYLDVAQFTPTRTILGTAPAPFPVSVDTYYTLRLVTLTNGLWAVYLGRQGAKLNLYASGQSADLATGGTLASGRLGIYDGKSGATTTVTRTYDNFVAWVPTPDAVICASRSAQLTTQGHYRLDSGGTAYGPVSMSEGDLPRLPPEGLESRTTEVFLKPSRGDFDQLPDSGIDDVSARVYYRPSYLFVP